MKLEKAVKIARDLAEIRNAGDSYWTEGQREATAAIEALADFAAERLAEESAARLPNPGEGWRLLETGETVMESDEMTSRSNFFQGMIGGWTDTSGGYVGDRIDARGFLSKSEFDFYVRRRIPPPSFSAGDWVRCPDGRIRQIAEKMQQKS